jgi:four helix bundle protein
MVVKTFEDLNVYQEARILTKSIYKITKLYHFAQDRALVAQIRRAAVSVMSNIAEGFERESNTEFIRYLYISKGSAGEIRVQLTVAYDQEYIDQAKYENLTSDCKRISSMLRRFIAYLKASPIAGPKHKSSKRILKT